MGMTMSEKILADHANVENVCPGEIITAKIDLVLGNEISTPMAVKDFIRFKKQEVFDENKIVIIPDHFVPNKDLQAAEQAKITKEFAMRYFIKNYYEVGRSGIAHCFLPEQGLVMPSNVVVGADSHTCTYGALGAFAIGVGSTDFAVAVNKGKIWIRVPETIKIILEGKGFQEWVSGKDLALYLLSQIGVDGANYKVLEYHDETLEHISIDGRFTIANMSVEAGAKAGIFNVDQVSIDFIESRKKGDYFIHYSDKDAYFCEVIKIKLDDIPPYVALPYSPGNGVPIYDVPEVMLDQVVIGSCVNGRMDDMLIAAKILNGKQISDKLRLIIIPGTQGIYLECLRKGLIETFIEAGAVVSTPTCGPCLGAHMGVLASHEKALSTTNRNFIGRMGHTSSEVYLSSPAVAAASAVAGKIIHPGEVFK